MKNICFALTLAILLAVLDSGRVNAYLKEYAPLRSSDLKNVFKLKTVSEEGLKQGKTIKIGSAEMKLPKDGDDIIFSGVDNNGKPWTLTKYYYGLGTCYFTGDLDGNRSEDIVLLQATGACGIAPPAVLTALLFDREGRPFPFETSGYFGADDNSWNAKNKFGKIEDLIQIGSDRRAVLICQQLDSSEIGGRNRSYWRNILYRAVNGRWQRISTYEGKSVPMLVRYTFKSNHRVIPPPVPSLKVFDDGVYSGTIEGTGRGSQSCKTGKLMSADFTESGEITKIQLDSGTQISSHWRTFFSPFLVHATRKRLDIISLESTKGKAALREAANKKSKIRYFPGSIPGELPLYIWLID